MKATVVKLISYCRTWPSVLTISLLISILTPTAKSLGDYEPRSQFKCRPLPTSYGLAIQCPLFDRNIIIRIQSNSKVQIECAQMSEKDYAMLLPMDVGDATIVQIRRCPLPRGLSLKSILKWIRLLFQRYVTDFDRQFLQELSDLDDWELRWSGFIWPALESNWILLKKPDLLELGYTNRQNLEPKWPELISDFYPENFFDFYPENLKHFPSQILTDVNLRENDRTKLSGALLSEGLLSDDKKLTHIRVLDNRQKIETLPSEFLANFPTLEVVHIQCGLKLVPRNIFLGSGKITNLSLTENAIESLPSGLFSNQTNMVDLDLSRNKLTELPDDIFFNTKSLIVLDLSYNNLENISSDLFGNLQNLMELYLQNNNLHHIDLHAFIRTKNLKIIEAQNNQLSFKDVADGVNENYASELASPFQYITELKSLNLRNNSISYIIPDWIFLGNLQLLDLSFNHINMLNIIDLLFSARNLTVNLSHNDIEEIDFSTIEKINLPGKKISVEIGENPLICNCVKLPFVQFIHGDVAQSLQKNLDVIHRNLQCAGPVQLKDRSVLSLHYHELLCPIEKCPSECSTCLRRPIDLTLIVNCSDSGLTEVPALPRVSDFGLHSIELHIENNNITNLPSRDHPGYSNVSELHASKNNISQFTTLNIPASLQILDLSNNSLSWINATVFEAINKTNQLTRVSLGNNPWRCNCNALHLLSFVRTNFKRIQDLSLIKCSTGAKLSSLSPGDLCKEDQVLIVVACVVAVFGLMFGLLASLYHRFHAEIKVWLYAHNMCLWFVTEEELDRDKKYDAFISYSHKDEEFVADHLLKNLENGPEQYKLYLHERDWVIGDYIPSQIIRSVQDSRRTIIVLSTNFLESVWARMEFQVAHKAALQEGRARIIIIIYGDVGNTDNLDPELKAYLTMNTYVKWGDPWFWKKLHYAMPHPSHIRPGANGLVKNSLKSSTDSNLELI